MAEFLEIGSVYKTGKKLGPVEMLRAIKLAIASEFEAIQIYQQIMESTDDRRIINVLQEITNDSSARLKTTISPIQFKHDKETENHIYSPFNIY